MKNMDIQEIIEALEVFDGKYKREEIDATLKLKDEITPHLIAILKKVLDDPLSYIEADSDYDGHTYAVMLLSHFKETKAHNLIIELFSLPGEVPYELFGDITTEDLPALLYSTCGGSLEGIKTMVLNKGIDEFCRSSALTAMVYAGVGGMVPREEVVEFFGSLFPGENEEKDDYELYSSLAYAVCKIYPEELMDKIVIAYKEELIDTSRIDLDSFYDTLAEGKEKTLNWVRKDMERRLSADIHARMSWWACFKESNSRPLAHPSGLKLTFPSKKKKKKKRKKK